MSHILYDLQGFRLARRIICTSYPPHGDLSSRGRVAGFSARSGARMRRYLRCCVPNYTVFITLTYPSEFNRDGRASKRDLDVFIKRFRYRVSVADFDLPASSRVKFSAFWFLEFQKRGAPHFHLFCTHSIPRLELSKIWYEIVGSDDSRHLLAGTRIESIRSGKFGMVSYALKYAAKAEQKEIPSDYVNCGRFWGVYGDRECYAATLVFPANCAKNDEHAPFLAELRELLKNAGSEASGKRYGAYSVIAYLKNKGLIAAVNALFHRYGALGAVRDAGTLFESPLLDCPIEEES